MIDENVKRKKKKKKKKKKKRGNREEGSKRFSVVGSISRKMHREENVRVPTRVDRKKKKGKKKKNLNRENQRATSLRSRVACTIFRSFANRTYVRTYDVFTRVVTCEAAYFRFLPGDSRRSRACTHERSRGSGKRFAESGWGVWGRGCMLANV